LSSAARLIGPAGSVAVALAIIDRDHPLDAAVLDCNLRGEKVWPVADELSARKIPFLFSTGYGAAGVEPRFSTRPVLAKPYNAQRLAHALFRNFEMRPAPERPTCRRRGGESCSALLLCPATKTRNRFRN